MVLNRTHEDRATLEGITHFRGAREAPQGCTLGYPVYKLSRDTSVITLVPGSALVFSEHGEHSSPRADDRLSHALQMGKPRPKSFRGMICFYFVNVKTGVQRDQATSSKSHSCSCSIVLH